MDLETVKERLAQYDGPECTFMEVCGTHTASIVRNGIPSLLSPRIHLVSGPGCPVCVTVTAYIDRLIELARMPGTVVCAFGDLLRVKGSRGSLADARAEGGRVRMLYSPMEMLQLAAENEGQTWIFAAVGFETTAPVYALLVREVRERNLRNVRLLTSLKTMPEAIRMLCREDSGRKLKGFLAPGHVCAVTGCGEYRALAEELGLPFVVSGFEAEEILAALYGLLRLQGRGEVRNFYPQAVREEGNPTAKEAMSEVFAPAAAAWRGLGLLKNSGLYLREEYADLDAGSAALTEDCIGNGCRCPEVLTGRISPAECPLFGTACTPASPRGSCMVSQEGTCRSCYAAGLRHRDSQDGVVLRRRTANAGPRHRDSQG